MNHPINSKFFILKPAKVKKNDFINQELRPAAEVIYSCPHCEQSNKLRIIPYKTGYPLAHLLTNGYLKEEEIIKFNIATKPSPLSRHFGDYLVENLPTLYLLEKCSACKSDNLVVFGLGESQPGLWRCKIAGIWQVHV